MDVISVKIMRTDSLTKGFAQFARDFHGRVGFTDCLVADRHPQFNHPVALVAKNTFINCVDFLESLEARSNRVLYKSENGKQFCQQQDKASHCPISCS